MKLKPMLRLTPLSDHLMPIMLWLTNAFSAISSGGREFLWDRTVIAQISPVTRHLGCLFSRQFVFDGQLGQ
jgi:hypothetical protein